MSDLIINKNGDLGSSKIKDLVVSNTQTIESIYDLTSTENYITTLIRRAIETPKGHITAPTISLETIEFVDQDFGSDIYKELSEGITVNFLARVKKHILISLEKAKLSAYISSVTVNMTNAYTVELNVSYTNNTPNTFIRIEI